MRWINSLTIMFAILLLAACGPRRAEVEPPRPTITPVPTFTLTPVGAAAAVSSGQVSQPAQSQPVATTAPPTAAPTPRPMANFGTLMNVRAGPGTNYGIIGTASPGQQFTITGKSPGLGDWWEIEYTETLRGWVYSPLVTATNAGSVALAQFIPAPPPPTATPIPAPTPVPAPTQPPAPLHRYSLTSTGNCPLNNQQTYFEGKVYDKNNNLSDGVCFHIAFNGPRNTKCSGCGKPTGHWGFSPFGGPADPGTHVEIWVVNCPGGGWNKEKSNTKDFGNLAQLSEKWSRTISESAACSDITFREN